MAASGGTSEDCYRKTLDAFSTYDQAVDIVSCWQSFFEYAHRDIVAFFDRYPSLGERDLTPDFTVLFGADYGLIGEIKRTLPRDPVAFRRDLEQLQAYDEALPLKANERGNTVVPTAHDIMLVTSMVSSYEVASRIQELLDDRESGVSFNNNLVIVEYIYDAGDRISRYIFRKLPANNRSFRDTALPHDLRLEIIMGDQLRPIEGYPKHFVPVKVREVFCNDAPPPIYSTAYLWHKVFYDYLDAEQRGVWKRGSSQKTMEIAVEVGELTTSINRDYIPGGGVRKSWIQDALEFLVVADLAERTTDGEYRILFRNLTQVPRLMREREEYTNELFRDLAPQLAARYCSKPSSERRKPKSRPKGEQQKLAMNEN